MKLTAKGQYAVTAMADLASAGAGSTPLSAIAERQDISPAYLEQLFAKLRRSGLITAVRGPGGGYALSRPAEDIRVADILIAAEEPIQTTRCAPGSAIGCTGESARCLTHDLWDELARHIHLYLNAVSLADVLARRVPAAARPAHAPVLETAETA